MKANFCLAPLNMLWYKPNRYNRNIAVPWKANAQTKKHNKCIFFLKRKTPPFLPLSCVFFLLSPLSICLYLPSICLYLPSICLYIPISAFHLPSICLYLPSICLLSASICLLSALYLPISAFYLPPPSKCNFLTAVAMVPYLYSASYNPANHTINFAGYTITLILLGLKNLKKHPVYGRPMNLLACAYGSTNTHFFFRFIVLVLFRRQKQEKYKTNMKMRKRNMRRREEEMDEEEEREEKDEEWGRH